MNSILEILEAIDITFKIMFRTVMLKIKRKYILNTHTLCLQNNKLRNA